MAQSGEKATVNQVLRLIEQLSPSEKGKLQRELAKTRTEHTELIMSLMGKYANVQTSSDGFAHRKLDEIERESH